MPTHQTRDAGMVDTAFNTAAADFLEDLRTAFPAVGVFGLLAELHAAASAVDRAVPRERFREHVMRSYGEALRRRAFDEIMTTSPFDEVPRNECVVDHIKALWADMTPENRRCVEAHLDLLVRLADSDTVFLEKLNQTAPRF